MKRILVLTCILINLFTASAQQITISDSAKISLITCSPGEEVYEKFGHTAIRIKDPQNNLDITFNYGIFSFDSNNFYLRFIKGETDYQLGIYETGNFLPDYQSRNSMVWEQSLNLNPTERRRIINLLLENYSIENRVYRYNFVFDNCATRPRDKILESLDGYIKFLPNNSPKTFRQWIGVYVGTDTWLKFGIDVIFGMEADRVASQSESMFLPEVLMNEFEAAQVKMANGTKKLVSKKNVLVNKVTPAKPIDSSSIIKPTAFSILLLILGALMTAWDAKRRRPTKWVDTVLLSITGIGGLIVFYLMVFSSHPLVKMNFNILWLNPLNIIIGGLIWIKSVKLRRILFFYEVFNIALLIGALVAFAISAQVFNSASFPLIVLLLVRASSWSGYTKRKLFKKHRDI
jgi:hypothetical protein